MPTTIRKGTKPSSDSDVRPLTASDTQTATEATGGIHRSSASHQSTFDGYQCIVSVVIVHSVVTARRCSERRVDLRRAGSNSSARYTNVTGTHGTSLARE